MKNLLIGTTRMFFAPEGDRVGSAFDAPPAGGAGAGAGDAAAIAAAAAAAAGAKPQLGADGKPIVAEVKPNAWFEKLPPERQAYAKNKGWDKAEDPASAIFDGYENLEKVFGADKAGRTLLMPKDANDVEGYNAIYDKLGRPKTPDEYTIEVPAGADDGLAKTFKTVFHKEGLNTKQAKTLTDVYKAAELDQMAKIKEVHADQVEALQKEWGDKYEGNVEVARAAINAAGLDKADVKRMENSMGPLKFTKMMEFFGKNYAEAKAPGVDTRDGAGNLGMTKLTPQQAHEKMAALRVDKNFMDRYAHNDPKIREIAMNEMNALSLIAVNHKAQ